MNFAGDLSEISLPQLIENIYLKKQTGHLRVEHLQQTSTLSFQEGELVDAEFGEDVGPEAVYRAMSLPASTSYEFEPGTVAARRTIDEPWQRVVLKGFCQLKKVKAAKRAPVAGKATPTAEPRKQPRPSPGVSSLPLAPPRQRFSMRGVAIATVSATVIAAVIGAAVVIASYSGGTGDRRRSEASSSSIRQSSVAPAAPGASSSPKMNESAPARPAASVPGWDAAAGRPEGYRADEIAKQTQADVRPSTDSEPAGELKSAPAPAEDRAPGATAGDWFVILRTFPKKNYIEAAESSEHFRSLGHDTQVIDTGTYPNFKGGMWAVMLGPYSHEAATEEVRKLRPLVPDAYAKPGTAPTLQE